MPSKVLIMSDVHLCHINWYGLSCEERIEKMICDLNAAYEKDVYDAIFFLGDYSLDHWVYDIGGSYLHRGVSNTKRLVDDYLSRLLCPVRYMIPGNHEQYGHEQWEAITGRKRQFAVFHQGYLFIMLDNFGGNLNPSEDSDGTYTPADLDFIRTQMAQHPDAPVLLCAHYFDLRKETDAFRAFVQNEKRILCLFCGHDHTNKIEASAALGGKLIIHDGHFSYAGYQDPSRCPWGWLEVMLYDEGVTCSYTCPESVIDSADGAIPIHAAQGAQIQIGMNADRTFPRRK